MSLISLDISLEIFHKRFLNDYKFPKHIHFFLNQQPNSRQECPQRERTFLCDGFGLYEEMSARNSAAGLSFLNVIQNLPIHLHSSIIWTRTIDQKVLRTLSKNLFYGPRKFSRMNSSYRPMSSRHSPEIFLIYPRICSRSYQNVTQKFWTSKNYLSLIRTSSGFASSYFSP